MSTPLRRSYRMLLAFAIAASLTTAPAASAHPGLPLPVFDPATVGWASVRDRTEADFRAEVDAWVARDYMIIDLEADMTAGGPRLGAVFQRNTDGRRWIVDTELTGAELEAGPVDQWDPGLRLVDVETYLLNGARRYAAVWVENLENLGTDARHDLTYEQAVAYHEEQRHTRIPIDVDSYPYGTGVRYALIWLDNVENLPWRLHLSLSSAEFATAFDAYLTDGYRMLVVDSVQASAGQRYAGIWWKNTSERQTRERRDLTDPAYAAWWQQYAGDGFRLIGYERYETAHGTRYAGVWRQN